MQITIFEGKPATSLTFVRQILHSFGLQTENCAEEYRSVTRMKNVNKH